MNIYEMILKRRTIRPFQKKKFPMKFWRNVSIQDILVLDIDSTTHSLESRKREKAVVGRNKKNRGKPCYQWSVAFVR